MRINNEAVTEGITRFPLTTPRVVPQWCRMGVIINQYIPKTITFLQDVPDAPAE
jgi:hypothetical protein